MSLTLNGIAFSVRSDTLEVLGINAFVETFKYDISKLYIDKFWSALNNNEWIVVDYAMLRWMGYDCSRDRANREKYRKLLMENFNDGIDYETVSGADSRIRHTNVAQRNTILVRAKTFKKSLMMIRTERAETIRDYFLLLEEIMLDYMRYTKFVSEHNSDLEKLKLKEEIDKYKRLMEDSQVSFDISSEPIKMEEYVYVLTSKRYYRQSIFKIGRSVDPKSRLISHNTTAAMPDDDKFYTHVIPTFDGGALEKTLHRALAHYRTTKEWFKIPPQQLLDIVESVITQQTLLVDKINMHLSRGFDNIAPFPLEDFISKKAVMSGRSDFRLESATLPFVMKESPAIVTPSKTTVPKMICAKCSKEYLSEAPYHKHIAVCTADPSPKATVDKMVCTKCSKQYLLLKPFQKHISICKGAKCDTCGMIFSTLRELRVHNQRKIKCTRGSTPATPDPSKCLFKCKDCETSFSTARRYENHVSGGCKYRIPCPQCKRIFKGNMYLEQHLERSECGRAKVLNTPDFAWRCSGCRKKFMRQTDAFKHVKSCEVRR